VERQTLHIDTQFLLLDAPICRHGYLAVDDCLGAGTNETLRWLFGGDFSAWPVARRLIARY